MDTNTKKIDILNRGEFIQRAVDIVKLISSHKGNMTFAIDGAWGCGKTFVLEEIEDRLSNDPSKNYLVIPYNCWQYDYYDEPLVALVAALNDFADSTKVIPEDAKTEIKHIFGKVGLKLFSQIIKNKIGIDAEELISTTKEAITDASNAVKDQHEFDSFYGFKQVLVTLHEELKKLTEKYTLVLSVDELDRCLPEYAIKVLERLHHVTDDLPNTVCIVAVDKSRLENTVNSIFGENKQGNTAEDYLKKFIRFEIKLDNGKQNGQVFFEKFPEFVNRFDASLYGELNGGEKLLEELFDGISPREQEMIVEKATIFNDICFGIEKQDYSMMYMELFLATLHYHYHQESIFSNRKVVMSHTDVFAGYNNMPKAFRGKDSGFNFQRENVYQAYPGNEIEVDRKNIFIVVFYYGYHTPKQKGEIQRGEFIPRIKELNELRIHDNLEKLKRNIEILKTIR